MGLLPNSRLHTRFMHDMAQAERGTKEMRRKRRGGKEGATTRRTAQELRGGDWAA